MRKYMRRIWPLLAAYLLLTPSTAFAYLDPGSGSMLLYFIMGVFATLIYYFKGAVYAVRAFFSGGKVDQSLRDLSGIDILFYYEGGQYWNVYQPVIAALDKQGIKSAYYTSDASDPGLHSGYKHLKAAYIGDDLAAFTLLNNIRVRLFITTTPQLDVMQLKRSKGVQTYIHLIHAPTDVLIYKYFAFDFFDAVMCSGQHQIDGIRALEQAKNLPAKKLYETGLTYSDVLHRKKEQLRLQTESRAEQPLQSANPVTAHHGSNAVGIATGEATGKTILVAPTWYDGNLLEKYGSSLLLQLAQLGYEVILRPHPQTWVSKPELMESICTAIETQPNVRLDRNPSGEQSMAQADLLISDLSGIIFDFYFVFEKPVVLMKTDISTDGKEADFVEKEVWDIDNLA